MLKKIITWSLIYCLTFSPAVSLAADSSIQADRGAPKGQQPQVVSTAGGLPQVNISTPNKGGLSHNKYSSFDVGSKGAILNNSSKNVQTQLGGWVEGNPNLAAGQARIILNEVNSSRPSQLKGHVEVAGKRAEVIIANPSGINVDGGGFINASRATLTTGRPQLDPSGNLTGYRVEGGHIEITGRGLNAKEADYTDIISRTAAVNAGIWAGDLKVTTGRNVVSRDHERVEPLGAEEVSVSLDVSELGGMYAGHIRLIGTDKGLGVHNAGQIMAQVGQVVVTSDGRLENSGAIGGQKAVAIKALGAADNTGKIQSPGRVDIAAGGNFSNSGEVAAQGGMTITAGQDLVNKSQMTVAAGQGLAKSGQIRSGGPADLSAQGNFSNQGHILADGSITMAAIEGNFENKGQVETGGALSAQAGQGAANSGRMTAAEDISITAAEKSLANTGSIGSGGQMRLAAELGVENTGQIQAAKTMAITTLGGAFSNNGEITALGALTAKALGAITNLESLKSAAEIILTSLEGGLTNKGDIISGGPAKVLALESITNSGQIQSAGPLAVTSQKGAIESSGLMLSEKGLNARAHQDLTNGGEIMAGGDLSLVSETGSFINNGELFAGGETKFSFKSDFINGGTLRTAGDFSLNVETGSFENKGHVVAGKKGIISALNNIINSGEYLSGGETVIKAISGFFENSGSLSSGGRGEIKANGHWDNTGKILVAGDFAAEAREGYFTNKGDMTIGGDALVAAGLNLVTGRTFYAFGNISLKAKGYFQSSGEVAAGGAAEIKAGSSVETAGIFQAAKGLTIEAEGHLKNTADLISGGQTVVVASKDFDNAGSFKSVGDLSVKVGEFSNTGEIITSGAADITAKSGAANTGDFHSGGDLTLTSGRSFSNDGEIITAGSAGITAAESITNIGSIQSGGNFTVTSVGGGFENKGNVLSGKSLALASGQSVVSIGRIEVGEDFSLSGAVDLSNAGLILVAGDGEVGLGGSIVNSGSFLVNGGLTITAEGNWVNDGELSVGGHLRLTLGGGLNNQGQMLATDMSIITAGKFRNERLIDGGRVSVRAGAIENVYEGTLLGDHLILAAETILNGLDLNKTGTGTSGLIGARHRLDVAVSGTLTNREDGLIYAGGDLVFGGYIDENGLAQGRGGTVVNSSATIDVAGSIVANVDSFKNLNAHYATREVEKSRDVVAANFFTYGDPKWYIEGEGFVLEPSHRELPLEPYGKPKYYDRFSGQEIRTYREVTQSRPGYVYSGQDFVSTGSVLNDKSLIQAGGTFKIDAEAGGSYTSIEAKEPYSIILKGTVTRLKHREGKSYTKKDRWSANIESERGTEKLNVFINQPRQDKPGESNIKDNGQVNPNGWASLKDADTAGGSMDMPEKPDGVNVDETGEGQPKLKVPAPGVSLPAITLPPLNSNMFTVNPSPASNYLIETNPRLTNHKKWLSSDYMIERMSSDPNTVHKRLGDGFYEQRLVREQISNLTGFRYLGNYASDEEQYMALMVAGLEYAQEFSFTMGMSLSAEQMALLTSDIVWLEYVTVETEYGPVTALAPKVYLAPGREAVIMAGGGLAARDIDMNLDELNNGGGLMAANSLTIKAANINNTGAIGGSLVSLAALNNLNNIGGSITGRDAVTLSAGGDINLISTTASGRSEASRGGYSTITSLDQVASVRVTSEDGSLSMRAGGDINLKAANVESGGNASIRAEGDLNIAGVEVGSEYYGRGKKGYMKASQSEDVGSFISTGGALELAAGGDVTVVGSQALAGGALSLAAGGDVSVTEGRSSSYMDTYHKEEKRGFLSKSSTKLRTTIETDLAIGSSLSGNTVTITAGNDFTLRGSDVTATDGLSIAAGGNIDITGAENSSYRRDEKKTKKSGFSGGFSGGRVSVGYGKTKSGKQTTKEDAWHTASLVGSENGQVSLYAGKDVSITGSHVIAGTGDVAISGENVTIDNHLDTRDVSEKTYYKQSGFNVSVGLSGAAGAIVDSAVGAYDKIDKAKQATSDRAQALYGIAAGRELFNLGQGVKGIGAIADDIAQNGVSGAAAGGSVGVSISVGFSQQKSKSSSRDHSETVAGSMISSGGDTVIVARGSETENSGNLNIIGSNVQAGGTVTLAAQNDINLTSAQEVNTHQSKNKSSGSSIGASVSVGSGGYGISVDLAQNQGKGKGNSHSVSQVESIIQGAGGVDFISGNDTTLKGAQIIGEKVTGLVGGDLTIASEQDTVKEKYSQSSSSTSVSIPVYGTAGGSFSHSSQNQKAEGDYASVNEQSGIFAGDGGFDIEVGGHTSLIGAVIESTAEATKNSLVTGSLSTEDIHNDSSYSAETKGLSVSAGDGKGMIAPSLPMEETGSDSSVTRSAVSEGTVIITNEEAQKNKTGQSAEETIASLNRDTENAHQGPLDHNPDLEKILDKQSEISDAASAAGKAVAETVGDIAKHFTDKYELAQGNEEALKALLDDPNASAEQKAWASDLLNILGDPDSYEQWKEGGAYKTALQAAGAALVAAIGNGEAVNAALGAAASQLAAGKVGEFAKTVAEQLSDDPEGQKVLASMLSNIASGAIGQAVGGETGAGAAAVMDRYNRQLHPAEIDWIKAEAAEYAQIRGISVEDATRELTQQALRMVDKWWAGVLPSIDQETEAAAIAFLNRASGNHFDDPEVSKVFYFQASGQAYENSGHLAEYLRDDDYFEFIKQYGTSGITSDINGVPPSSGSLIDFKWLFNSSEQASALDGLSPQDQAAVKNLLEIYATTTDVGRANYALLASIFNQYPIDGGPPLNGNEDAYKLVERINEIYGSDSAAYIIYNEFAGKLNSELGSYFINASTIATLAKNVKAANAEKAGKEAVLADNGKYADGTASNTGVKWGQGIQQQGMPWEEYIAKQYPSEARLPKGFKTFDFFDSETKTAISAKTLDTTSPAKVNNPAQVYYSLKKNIDDAANFESHQRMEGALTSGEIIYREVHVAIPRGTTTAQWAQIKKAQGYAKSQGVLLKVTEIQ